ncbi:MAG: LysM peptidoglycan-binding domain-containing M23 family metallopeptidase [Amaricoccus sp.]|uniref:peptidoglycan DD-metalloendopeptidase family protein n=1 Tax=Amaricoccus sp. TaxID=1872485 RepID=UPI0039E4176C
MRRTPDSSDSALRPAAIARLALVLAATLGVAGCAGNSWNPWGGNAGPVDAAAPAPAVQNLPEDSRGVITYASYQVAVTKDGDTLQSVAARVGTTPEALAKRNALPADYLLHQGEVLLLPDGVARPATGLDDGGVSTQPLGGAWSAATAAAAIDGASPSGGTTPAPAAAGSSANPFQNGQKTPLIDPVRHRVEKGETAYSIARLYGVSVTALASWNGLGPDLAVREKQELLIPIVSDANRISSAADVDTQPGQGTPVAPPPLAAEPLPDDIAEAAEPASPNLGQYRTPQGGRLGAPVSGAVTRKFNAAHPNGIAFSAAPGTAVHAAGSGEVAAVTDAVGGLGTIVLIRHKDDLITTYSTLSDVTVKEGDRVQSGQVIGKVAERDKPELQFDVFRGTTNVDPTPYLGG